MGTPEIVVKRAWPFSSRFTPEAAPIGFSGAFSSAGARVFKAQSFSEADGLRSLKTSAIGFSATCFGDLSWAIFLRLFTLMIEGPETSGKVGEISRTAQYGPTTG